MKKRPAQQEINDAICVAVPQTSSLTLPEAIIKQSSISDNRNSSEQPVFTAVSQSDDTITGRWRAERHSMITSK